MLEVREHSEGPVRVTRNKGRPRHQHRASGIIGEPLEESHGALRGDCRVIRVPRPGEGEGVARGSVAVLGGVLTGGLEGGQRRGRRLRPEHPARRKVTHAVHREISHNLRRIDEGTALGVRDRPLLQQAEEHHAAYVRIVGVVDLIHVQAGEEAQTERRHGPLIHLQAAVRLTGLDVQPSEEGILIHVAIGGHQGQLHSIDRHLRDHHQNGPVIPHPHGSQVRHVARLPIGPADLQVQSRRGQVVEDLPDPVAPFGRFLDLLSINGRNVHPTHLDRGDDGVLDQREDDFDAAFGALQIALGLLRVEEPQLDGSVEVLLYRLQLELTADLAGHHRLDRRAVDLDQAFDPYVRNGLSHGR